MKWTPYKFQVRAAKFLLERGGAGLWLDPGLGKTSIVLASLTAMKRAGKLKQALVIAPLRVAQFTWPAERRKWGTDFGELEMSILHGPDKAKLLDLPADVQIINPEGLPWLFQIAASYKNWPWNVLVVDESTKFKSWKAQRTKLLRHFIGKFDRRWTLTGTPAPNGLQDVFSQAYLMDGGHALGPFITHFRAKYMMQGGYLGYQYFPKPGAWEEVADKLKPLVMRLEAKDWIDLPELTYQTITVELPPVARTLYRELEKQFYIDLEGGQVVAGNAAALGMKLRQATNGHVYLESGEIAPLHLAKIEALEDLVEELGQSPLLVAVAFLSEVKAIRKALAYDVPYLGGGVKTADANRIINDWNAGKLPVLLAHPTSVAHGLNLQEAGHHICWFGLTWNLEEYDQFIRRVWRQGQKNHVIVHHIMASNTMDQPVLEALQAKEKNQTMLLRRIKEFRK